MEVNKAVKERPGILLSWILESQFQCLRLSVHNLWSPTKHLPLFLCLFWINKDGSRYKWVKGTTSNSCKEDILPYKISG